MADHAILAGKRVLLVIAGGIAAYKSLELIRRLRERGVTVRAVLTEAGARFVTPLSVQALTEDTVYRDLWSLTDESEMGHIRLSREADLLVVAPATANLLARMAAGMADDLAATVLLATDKPVLVAPAMNVRMWQHAATQANMALLESRGVRRIGPNDGVMACNEYGPGRMAEPMEIVDAIAGFFAAEAHRPLAGRRAIVTSGPTHEPIDPVRYIANRSSGKQGHAIAAALAALGAEVTLVSGPTRLPDPAGCRVAHIETAREMLAACEAALPADIAVCAAAVADWRVDGAGDRKLKKDGSGPPALALTENPDILATLSRPGERRPALVVGFAAETGDVLAYATAKRARKGCDWIVANDVSPGTGTFGGSDNTVHLIRADGVESWPTMPKDAVATRLAEAVAEYFKGK
ncbi:bifunctional phosphopantothenoylcysteine decarboxylase/phosphopantothenate--cysteine ligase CoaBC [Azospirillum sp. A1-3]|uniref:bifunctional phosphopantothenoylcysteine decarboxylase/phosphopantothenate--cysteine ligase CoaBC n=1 Tax=unclassified Azospirillum TaxID=2630922 RepID=UPI000D60F395|nr:MULTISPECIES: bifunctional phosphopantothenoylcysteine decarboxylase/phosphopantothenate--cysteine ligase CoaBC [unclassified Azospirillum]MCM8735121.1 bifunctional phosphopantothenoylcysteine decarboxylase/phosphopantothenate--cysteine ligase CoaBC [Azospirillum sp. A1-3]PWC92703.1 bifunctional phosphopantothenoylcysteine decarboxylase/phosphopantothenate synthase [Azospirillum sp. TSO5]